VVGWVGQGGIWDCTVLRFLSCFWVWGFASGCESGRLICTVGGGRRGVWALHWGGYWMDVGLLTAR